MSDDQVIEMFDEIKFEAVGNTLVLHKLEAEQTINGIYIPTGAVDRPWGRVVHVGPEVKQKFEVGEILIFTNAMPLETTGKTNRLYVMREASILARVVLDDAKDSVDTAGSAGKDQAVPVH